MGLGIIISFIVSIVGDLWSNCIANRMIRGIVRIMWSIAGFLIGSIVEDKFAKRDPLWYQEHEGK